MTESERKKIPDLDSREAKGMATMLFSFETEEGDERFCHLKKHPLSIE